MRLIIDCHSLAYKFVFEMTNLSSGKNKTNVIYGFLKRILTFAETYKTNQFVFCWDSQQSYRKMHYPDIGYKDRPQNPALANTIKAAKEQFTLLRQDVLPSMGFKNIFIQTGYEADDLIASVVNNPGRYIIITGDQDLYQLLEEGRAEIHEIKSDKLFTESAFREKHHNLSPSQWVDVKAIGGCSSDNVSGIPRVGEKSAIEWLAGTLKQGKMREKIESPENKDIVDRCRKLVKLPYEGDRQISLTTLHTDQFYSLNLIDAFKKYNCMSFVNDINRWYSAFNVIPGR